MAASVGAAFGMGKTLDFRDHEAWQEEAEMSAAAALVASEEEGTRITKDDESNHGSLAGLGVANQKRLVMQKKPKTSTRRRVIVAVVSAAELGEDAAGKTAGQVCLGMMFIVP